MLPRSICYALVWVSGLWCVDAGVSPTDVSLVARNAPNMTSADTLRAIGRALTRASLSKRGELFKNSTTVEKSWSNATLLSLNTDASASTKHSNTSASLGIEVICTNCYVQAKATASLALDGSFNFTSAFDNITSQIGDDFKNITESAIDFVEDYVKEIAGNVVHLDFNPEDYALPPFEVDFTLVMPEIPQAVFTFVFDKMELYVELDVILTGAMTYTLSLYNSETPVGIAIGDELQAGIIVSMDLILSSEAEIDLTGGFHIQLDDGVAFQLALFSQNVTDTNFNGGKFEFLPVTITGQGSLSAVLRVGMSAGFELSAGAGDFSVSAGVTTQVFAHVAEFTTNVTASTDADSNEGCALRIEESYQLALGAAAGASVAVDTHTWGPAPATTVPVWFTNLAAACITARTKASTATASVSTTSASTKTTATTSASLDARADDATITSSAAISSGTKLTTTTLTTTDTYTGVQCLSTGLADCPVSLQTTAITRSTRTLVTAVASGVKATFPTSVHTTVAATRTFGTAARELFATSGSPTSFSPTATATSGVLGALSGADTRVVIGVAVGVGVVVLVAFIAGVWYCRKRRRNQSAAMGGPSMAGSPPMTGYGYGGPMKPNPAVRTRMR